MLATESEERAFIEDHHALPLHLLLPASKTRLIEEFVVPRFAALGNAKADLSRQAYNPPPQA
jgi:hypothetical protein